MTRNIFSYTLASGAGSQTILSTIDHDLSRAEALRLRLNLTAAATDAGDTLNIRLQEYNGFVWNTRARFPQYLGTATVSASAPESYEMTIPAQESISNSDKGYEPSGSAGATEILAGQVIPGPFQSWWFNAAPAQAGQHLRQARYRFKIDVVDAGGQNANFGGILELWCDTPGTSVA